MSFYTKVQKCHRNKAIEWINESVVPNCFGDVHVKYSVCKLFADADISSVLEPLIADMDLINNQQVVSLFCIGLLIKQKLSPDLKIISNNCDKYEFSYLWFLVCLFHDMGYLQEADCRYKYIYEQRTKEYLEIYKCTKENNKQQRQIYRELGLLYVAPSLYRSKAPASAEKIIPETENGILFNNGIHIDRAMYPRDTILNYLEYCKMDENIRHYDHGIIGGLWLYDCLLKIYNIQYQKEKLYNHCCVFDDFWVNGNIHFSGEQRKVFAYMADCVISHHMRPADQQTNERYKQYELDDLM